MHSSDITKVGLTPINFIWLIYNINQQISNQPNTSGQSDDIQLNKISKVSSDTWQWELSHTLLFLCCVIKTDNWLLEQLVSLVSFQLRKST